MKFRTGFVSNSSSSSFVIVYKILDYDKLCSFVLEGYGKFGERLLKEYVKDSSHKGFPEFVYDNYSDVVDYTLDLTEEEILEKHLKEKFPDGKYIFARNYVWSTEGDKDGEDAFFANMVAGEEFAELFMETEAS